MRYVIIYLTSLLTVITLHAEVVNVYFGTGGGIAAGIYRASLDTENGKLTSAALATEIGSTGFMAWSPDRNYLYAVASHQKDSVVAAYAVLSSGELKLLNTTKMEAGRAAHIAVHPSGAFLITAHYGSGKVSVFSIDQNGNVGKCYQIITHEGGSNVVAKRQSKPHPHWTGFSPDGKFAFVPDLGLDQIIIYQVDLNDDQPRLNASGVAESVPGGGPRHMKFSVDGKFIYLLNELTLSVTSFDYDAATGSATLHTTTPALSEEAKAKEVFNSASEILVHPNGQFVYSANRGHDSVTVYRANPQSGKLNVIEVEPIRGAWPRNINLDKSGKWLLAAGADSNTVSVFSIDPDTGELTFQRKSSINVPGAICILIND